MNPKVSVFIATSLDGFIARENGEIDWLDAATADAPAGEDFGYHSFIESVDALVMGRYSYEKVLSFGTWPYGDTPVTVMSSNPISFLDGAPSTVKHSSEEPRVLCERLSREGVKHIYVDGGITIQRFLAAGLIDELTITLIPTLLGAGIPLFGPLAADVQLQCLGTKAYELGLVQLQYSVVRDG